MSSQPGLRTHEFDEGYCSGTFSRGVGMATTLYRGWVVVASIAVVLAVAGAGGRLRPELGKSARQISIDALHAAEHARTVQISGVESIPGAEIGSSSIPAMQMHLNVVVRQGTALKGTFGPSTELLDIVVIRSCTTSTSSLKPTRTCSWSVYTQIPADELPSPGPSAQWLELPAPAAQLSPLAPLPDLGKFFSFLAHPIGKLHKAGTGVVDGVPVIWLGSTRGGAVAVAEHGTPFPVEVVGPGGSNPMTFTRWNKPVKIEEPKGAIKPSGPGLPTAGLPFPGSQSSVPW